LAGRHPLAFHEGVQHPMPEGFAEGFQGNPGGQLKVPFSVKAPGGGQAMDVRVIGEIIAKGMDTQDNSHFSIRHARGVAHAFGQYLRHHPAKDREPLGVLSKHIADDLGNGEYPVPVGYIDAYFLREGFSFFQGTPAGGRLGDPPLFTGEGKQVVVVALLATDPEKTLGQVPAAKVVIEGRFPFGSDWA